MSVERTLLSDFGQGSLDTQQGPGITALSTGVLAGPPLERDIRLALAGLNLQLDFTDMSGLLINRIESDCPSLLIVDLDICPRPDEFARFARSLRGDVHIAAVHWYLAGREAPWFADAVVHKPVRRDEWFPTIARIALATTTFS